MRDYYFRAKALAGKEKNNWVYGYVFEKKDKIYILNNKNKEIEVDGDTVCEYCGYCVKQGVPVFNGDILANFFKGEGEGTYEDHDDGKTKFFVIAYNEEKMCWVQQWEDDSETPLTPAIIENAWLVGDIYMEEV